MVGEAVQGLSVRAYWRWPSPKALHDRLIDLRVLLLQHRKLRQHGLLLSDLAQCGLLLPELLWHGLLLARGGLLLSEGSLLRQHLLLPGHESLQCLRVLLRRHLRLLHALTHALAHPLLYPLHDHLICLRVLLLQRRKALHEHLQHLRLIRLPAQSAAQPKAQADHRNPLRMSPAPAAARPKMSERIFALASRFWMF